MKKTQKSFLYRDRAWLYTKYCGDGLTCEAIASLCNCHCRTIHQWLVNHKIPRRRKGYIVQSEDARQRRSVASKTNPLIIQALKRAQANAHNAVARFKASLKMRGANHYNWKGGVSSVNARARNSTYYREWRLAVFERDNYICQTCGQLGGYLQSHHLESFAKNLALIFDVSNGLTLCADCHSKLPGHHNVKNAYKRQVAVWNSHRRKDAKATA